MLVYKKMDGAVIQMNLLFVLLFVQMVLLKVLKNAMIMIQIPQTDVILVLLTHYGLV